MAVDEYRFQVELNWKRSEYFFVVNVAVLVAGAGLLSTSPGLPRGLIAAVFLVGAMLALLSIVANRAQHGYYRAARAVKQRLEGELQLADLALTTTPGMGSRVARLGRVRTFLAIMLSALAVADGVGFVVSITKAASDPGPSAELAVYVLAARPQSEIPLVVRRDGRVVERASARLGAPTLIQTRPGVHELSVFTTRICAKRYRVTDEALQVVRLQC